MQDLAFFPGQRHLRSSSGGLCFAENHIRNGVRAFENGAVPNDPSDRQGPRAVRKAASGFRV